MHTEMATQRRLIYVRADPGEDLLAVLQKTAEQEGIRHGTILRGVGSLSAYHHHVVGTAELPHENAHVRGERPFDILTDLGGDDSAWEIWMSNSFGRGTVSR